MLRGIYQASPAKIDLIPHGIPDIPFVDPNYYKDQFGVEGRVVLLTFGLLSPNKGIENVLNALPHILAQFPEVVYIILGATHPNELRERGEAYRLGLEILAKKNRVEKNVIFYNRFVELEELKEFIGAADLYITPYLNEGQQHIWLTKLLFIAIYAGVCAAASGLVVTSKICRCREPLTEFCPMMYMENVFIKNYSLGGEVKFSCQVLSVIQGRKHVRGPIGIQPLIVDCWTRHPYSLCFGEQGTDRGEHIMVYHALRCRNF